MPADVETPIKSGVSASDISDAELPVSQSEKESSDDLEDMEKARAELLVRIVIICLDFSKGPSLEDVGKFSQFLSLE